ncbi:hypothetical protein L2E82_36277 [Cichorium intybus]|uniref:Uncharacterized protein n=1 Tax=Cichorium intybus TaxID=13427 RepID=A0ACB9BR76_CICIN|nr:hypothetical protein L2E82_36277 [Cichorium intybus]
MKLIIFCLYVFLYFNCIGGTIYLPKNVSVPAIIAFGDSLLDVGNNNYITTMTKSNFLPYGKDFVGGKPTGRFSNGKTLADFFAKALGVKEYVPAYLNPFIKEKDLLTGVSFASGGTGYDPLTATLSSVIPVSIQLDMFKQYIWRLKSMVGEENVKNIINNSVFFVSSSSNDFLVNYYSVPMRRLQYDVPAYSNLLVKLAVSFIQDLHKLGARRIVVFSAPPLGCIPIERTLAGGSERKCVDKYNKAAILFNRKLKEHLHSLEKSLPQSRIAFSDFYNPLISIIENPHKYGFEVADQGCCGTGKLEMSYLCNELSATCQNDSSFFFWDSLHPTEKGCDIFTKIVLPDLVKSLF